MFFCRYKRCELAVKIAVVFTAMLLSTFSNADILNKMDERIITEDEINTVEVVLPSVENLMRSYGEEKNQTPTNKALASWTIEKLTTPTLEDNESYDPGEYYGRISEYSFSEALSASFNYNSSNEMKLKISYPAEYVAPSKIEINYIGRALSVLVFLAALYFVFLFNSSESHSDNLDVSQSSGTLKDNVSHYFGNHEYLSKNQQLLKIGEIFPSLAHDIKSPLQSIISATSIIRREKRKKTDTENSTTDDESSTKLDSTLDIIDELTYKIADDIKSFQKVCVNGSDEMLNQTCDDITNSISSYIAVKSKQIKRAIRFDTVNPSDYKNFHILCNEANLLKSLMYLTFEFIDLRYKRSDLSLSAEITNGDFIFSLIEKPGTSNLYSDLTTKDTFMFAKRHLEQIGGMITIKSHVNLNTIKVIIPTAEKHLLKYSA